ncbi:MAG: hypothetical protein AAFQ35_02575 [Pseudomonadota bacterium]
MKAESVPGRVRLIDYDRYTPSFNAPAGFIATPVFSGRRFVGVLAAQVSIDAVNQLMNRGGKWREEGLGKSGETYVVGSDRTMRSNSRFMIEKPEALEARLREAGVSPVTLIRTMERRDTVFEVGVDTPGVDAAIKGLTGQDVFDDYRGVRVLSAYRPVDVPDLDWVLMAEID